MTESFIFYEGAEGPGAIVRHFDDIGLPAHGKYMDDKKQDTGFKKKENPL